MGIKKSTFWFKNEDESKAHLRFIISDPDEDDMVMVVNMTTYRNTGREDTSCLLDVNDYPYKIKEKSYIKYSKSEELNYKKLIQDNFNKQINFEKEILDNLLIKIQQGAKKSKYLPEKYKKYFNFF